MAEFFAKIFRSRQLRSRIWFNFDAFDDIFDHSPAPWILAVVLVWVVVSVLLLLSLRAHRELESWQLGDEAPLTVHARCDFQYVDTVATQAARQMARQREPEYFRINASRSQSISRNFNDFFLYTENRLADLKQRRQYEIVPDSVPSKLAGEASPELLDALGRAYLRTRSYENFQFRLRRLIARGVISTADQEQRQPNRRMRTMDVGGRLSMQIRRVSDFPTPAEAAEQLTTILFPQEGAVAKEFTTIARMMLGSGNLDYDMEKSHEAAEKAAAMVEEKINNKNQGELLIAKGQKITLKLLDMLKAEARAMPNELVLSVFYYRIGLSALLLLFTVLFLYRLHPGLLRDNRKILLLALIVIIGIVINYGAMSFFGAAAREFKLIDQSFLVLALPIALVAVLTTVMLDYRTALCAGSLVVTLTVLMLQPPNPLMMMLRWMTFSALAGLMVLNVTNYRTYFIRVLLGVALMTALLNLDMFPGASPHDLSRGAILVAIAAFGTAIIALILIFTLELLFNVTTDMSLMVLCDYNHPLLERLKREAPGTMFHSMTVATLAEDAARVIHANPLKAKAGALYHDIGKLEMPQYFIENNHDSINLHMQLNPQMSSIIIRDHVKVGLTLAREYRLCRLVRDAIRTHHGDDLVYYFYSKALADGKDKGNPQSVVESQFRYAGLPPVGKELTIISLADACEAACRSIAKPNPVKIRNMVDSIFERRFLNGQLRRSVLTLEELDKVRESFIATIIGIHHGRIAYTPEESEHDQSKPQLAEPAPSGTGAK